MCIIQGDTRSVADTEIFCFPACNGRGQVTVYSNAVSMNSPGHNAMILPVPRGYEMFQMIDLSGDTDMFAKLDSCFPSDQTMDSDGPRSRGLSANSQAPYLAVQQCGSYEFSLVPSLRDFSRLDPASFQLSGDVGRLLQRQYPAGFAFLVCRITANKKFHPVGYLHPLAPGADLFIPTLHFHQGHAHGQPDWDHSIYVLGNSTLGRPAHSLHGLRQVRALQPYMCPGRPDRLRKLEVHGHHSNRDMVVPAVCDRPLPSWMSPSLTGLVAA